MSKAYYLTTPLYYVNDVPHIGHAYTTIIGDAIARYQRMSGLDVCYLTGMDEHGLKIERAARAANIEPPGLVDKNAAAFLKSWSRLGIEFDAVIRTTEKHHHQTVQDVFKRIEKNGFIYKGEYSGQYCVRCESFVAGNAEVCPDCNSPTEFVREESYFFKLSAFQEKLQKFYRDNPDFVIPSTRMNEVLSFVMGGLKDISISRTSFSWGIPVPDSKKHIFYVWFDALLGYVSGVGYSTDEKSFRQYWPAKVQLMGKDILRFHAVYWPAFLMAAGMDPPEQLLVHGWWTINGKKMSKSDGNFIPIDRLIDALPTDYTRYFLLREISLGSDGDFSYDGLVTKVNSDLANDLGNLASRVLKMIDNYFDGEIPESSGLESSDKQVVQFSKETIKLYQEHFDGLRINRALDHVWELISLSNKYLVANEPWAISKDSSKRDRLGTILYNAAEALRITAVLLAPIIPDGTASIFKQLGISGDLNDQRFDDLSWGGLQPGTRLGTIEPVYPRLNKKKFLAAVKGEAPAEEEKEPWKQPPAAKVDKIGIEDFQKVEMRVGKIVQAERVPKSDKLLRLRVDVGSELRQVVAGIGEAYDPEALQGKLVAVVTNLKPAKLMGLKSDGMIVAASVKGKPGLTTFSEPVEVGARLR